MNNFWKNFLALIIIIYTLQGLSAQAQSAMGMQCHGCATIVCPPNNIALGCPDPKSDKCRCYDCHADAECTTERGYPAGYVCSDFYCKSSKEVKNKLKKKLK